MNAIPITGHVDDGHRLIAQLPPSIPPGPITGLLVATTGPQADASTPSTPLRTVIRNGLPVVVVDPSTPPIDPELVRQILQEEGF
jgi:hypothetical protein